MKREFVVYNNEKYAKTKSGYYRATRVDVSGKKHYLHRVMWEDKHGPIPLGYEVHHIDRDRGNNSIDNLCLLSEEEHDKIHSQDRRPWKKHMQKITIKLTPVEKLVYKWVKREHNYKDLVRLTGLNKNSVRGALVQMVRCGAVRKYRHGYGRTTWEKSPAVGIL